MHDWGGGGGACTMSAEHSQPSTVFLSLDTILQMGAARTPTLQKRLMLREAKRPSPVHGS